MSALILQVTAAGRAAIVNAQNTGTTPLLVSQIGLTEQAFVAAADGSDVALPGELKRLATFAGDAVAADTIHVSITDDTADTYSLRGFAMYFDDGTLFALYGQADPIVEKSAQAMALLALDAIFEALDVTALTFGDTNFALPPATTEAQGIVELATEAEAEAGADAVRAITPATHKGAMDARFGVSAPSGFVKTLLTAATAIAFRALLAIKSAALYDTGADNGLDADLLDGQHGAYYRAWANLTGIPAAFPPLAHTHAWADITGAPIYTTRWADWTEVTNKPLTFPPSPHSQDWSTITGKPETATRWPAWAEVTGKPVFAAVATSGSYNDLANKPALAAVAISGSYNDLTGKPALNFLPSIGGRLTGTLQITGYSVPASGAGLELFYYSDGKAHLLGYDRTAAQRLPVVIDGASIEFAAPVSAPSYDSTASSRRAKHDIATSRYGLAEVLQMRFVEYRYLPHVVADQRLRFGLIVEELRPVAPELVTEPPESDPDKFPTVDYTQLGPVLGRALQQYIARTDARIAGMSREMAELADRIKLLESRA